MVECEFEQGGTRYSGENCFNRYMVECECFVLGIFMQAGFCFNRYMVECEYTNIRKCLENEVEF